MAPTDAGKLAPAEREMTVRHLFTHTSGVRDPRSRAETYAFPTMDAYMKDFAKLPLQAQPGAKWIYGDSPRRARLSGRARIQTKARPLPAAARARPAGHDRHALLASRGQAAPPGPCSWWTAKTTRSASRANPPRPPRRKRSSPAQSGLHTTAADYWRFCQMLLNGGELDGKRLLGPRTVSLIAENHLEQGNPVRSRPGLRPGLRRRPSTGPRPLRLIPSARTTGAGRKALCSGSTPPRN